MSTPIEIVREMQLWRRAEGKYSLDYYPHGMPFSPRQYGEAIDAVLRDAERFKALERAHGSRSIYAMCVEYHDSKGRFTKYDVAMCALAELADRLREETP